MQDFKVKRFEYTGWYEGDMIDDKEIARVISEFIFSKGAEMRAANYGSMSVPEEDIGEGPME